MNPQETAQAVLEQIRMNPETHSQEHWEAKDGLPEGLSGPASADSRCGTTRCVAGWAMYLHGYTAMLHQDYLLGRPEGDLDPVHVSGIWWRNALGSQVGVYHEASKLLGIKGRDAYNLFYHATNSQALHALEYLAKGEAIDWNAVRA